MFKEYYEFDTFLEKFFLEEYNFSDLMTFLMPSPYNKLQILYPLFIDIKGFKTYTPEEISNNLNMIKVGEMGSKLMNWFKNPKNTSASEFFKKLLEKIFPDMPKNDGISRNEWLKQNITKIADLNSPEMQELINTMKQNFDQPKEMSAVSK